MRRRVYPQCITSTFSSARTASCIPAYRTDLRKRVARHEDGEVLSTKGRRPVKLIFYEAFEHRKDARRREAYLKTTAGKRALKLMLREFFAQGAT